MDQKKAVIFGVTGQDGSHLSDLLIEKDYIVFGVARRSSQDNKDRIKHLLDNPSFKFLEGDVTDTHSIIHILKSTSPNEIYNLAAQSHVATSFKQPATTWDVTGKGCLNILQTMVDIGSNAKFYQASSSEMFGRSYDQHIGTHDKYQNEGTKFMPQSPYAIAKCAAHYMTRLYREAYGLHASCGILFNHEGPRRGELFVTRKITKWIGGFVNWCSDYGFDYLSGVVSSYPKLMLGNIDAYRDWGYAGDFVKAMWLMLQQENPGDYVICTGKTHTIKDFLSEAFKCINISDYSDYVHIDKSLYRPAEVDYLRGDCSKANKVLGWKAECSFQELVKMMVDHDIKNA